VADKNPPYSNKKSETHMSSRRPDQQQDAGVLTGILLLLMSSLAVMGTVLISPVLPLMITHFSTVHAASVLVPLSLVVPGLCIAITSPIAGVLTDALGRKSVLLVSFVAYAIAGTAPCWLDSLPWIMASRVIVGLAEAGIMTASTTLIADCFGPARRQRWLAGQTAVSSLSAIVLIGLGGLMGEMGWRTPFFAYGLAVLFVLPSIWMLPGRARQRLSFGGAAQLVQALRPIAWICGLTVFASIAFYVVPIQASLVLASRGITSPATIGLAASLGVAAAPAGAVVYGRLASRWPFTRLLALSFGLFGAGFMIVSVAGTFWPIVAGLVVASLGGGVVLPALISTATLRLAPELRGQGVGWWTAAFFFGQFCSPLAVAGTNIATHALVTTFGVFGVLSLLTAAGFLTRGRAGDTGRKNVLS
jgi:MFS family permease